VCLLDFLVDGLENVGLNSCLKYFLYSIMCKIQPQLSNPPHNIDIFKPQGTNFYFTTLLISR
jgi:hypothetical protein